MLAVVLSIAVALVPQGSTREAAPQRTAAKLPTKGVLVVGKSLAGVRLGYTEEKVRAVWGGAYKPCPQNFCKDPTWVYLYPRGEPLGAGVRFRNKKVIAVFTLGATAGWRSEQGVTIADPASRVYDLYGNPRYSKCIGFEALSIGGGNGVVTSFYLTSGVVYGFALTVPGLTPCQ